MSNFHPRKFILFFLLLLCVTVYEITCFHCKKLPDDISEHLDEYWYRYKALFNKTYSGHQDNARRYIWEKNLLKIYEHNLLAAAGHHRYTLRDNCLADLSTKEYLRDMATLIPSKRGCLIDKYMVGAFYHNPQDIPTHLDWREKGFLTRAENQRNCGSCYAYSVARGIQGQIFKQRGVLINLSVQQILDCSSFTGNLGCMGGSLGNTMRYLENIKGLMAENNYPYTALQGQCKFQEWLAVVNISSWAVLPARDERILEAAVAVIGPIAASINASPKTFQLYHEGIYDDSACSSSVVNHAVLIVGYTPEYWIIKNWWGYDWGEGGYMRLAKQRNLCGIANYAAYAKL